MMNDNDRKIVIFLKLCCISICSLWSKRERERERERENYYIADVYDANENYIGVKKIYNYDNKFKINQCLIESRKKYIENFIEYLSYGRNDFQHINYIFIINNKEQLPDPRGIVITKCNIQKCAVYFAVSHVITATWLNDRDQFLYPQDTWKNDTLFQTNCLTWTLFNNNIQAAQGVNHWIPFTENEVDAKEVFESHFMTDYMAGRITSEKTAESRTGQISLLDAAAKNASLPIPLVFSPEAKAVFDAGRELWKYYHTRPNANSNAALYDIKEYFQGRNAKGTLNTTSTDQGYTTRMKALREALKKLGESIEPKVYEHGFLKK